VGAADRRRPRRVGVALLVGGVLLIAGCGSSSSSSNGSSATTASTATGTTTSSPPSSGAIGPEGVRIEAGGPLAPASSTLPGTTVDGIQCAPIEQLAYHVHAHLQVYVNGQPRQLPGAIGLVNPVVQQTANGQFFGAQGCYYWLHTHTGDGIIHIESPSPRIYTLGDFFDEWHQPLSTGQVASATGPVTAFVNGKRWTRNPRLIPLSPHAVIQLSVGTPAVPFQPVSWAGLGL
jgi:hypothetical protein